jgi:TraY domain
VLIFKTNKEMGMARKRAPGAGRKPKGEFAGKSAVFSTRIKPDTRKALENAKRQSGRSLSQEIEKRLVDSFREEKSGDQGTRAFCYLIRELAKSIRFDPKTYWHNDPFLFETFKLAVPKLIDRLKPDGTAVPPPELGQFTPEHFATVTVLALWNKAVSFQPPGSHVEGPVAIAMYAMPQIRDDLGISFNDDPSNFFTSDKWRGKAKEGKS